MRALRGTMRWMLERMIPRLPRQHEVPEEPQVPPRQQAAGSQPPPVRRLERQELAQLEKVLLAGAGERREEYDEEDIFSHFPKH